MFDCAVHSHGNLNVGGYGFSPCALLFSQPPNLAAYAEICPQGLTGKKKRLAGRGEGFPCLTYATALVSRAKGKAKKGATGSGAPQRV